MKIAEAGLLLAAFMAVFDVAVVYVALPDMERTIGAHISDQQWIASAYALMEAGFTLAAGTIGDLWGRRRVHIAGVLIFALASLASGLAPNAGGLIAARFVQGIGGAIMMAMPLAMLVAMARTDAERAGAIRTFGTIAGLGAVTAPLLGGILVQTLGWRAIFFVNLPLAIAVLSAAVVWTPESPRVPGKRLDAGGQISSALALIAGSFVAIEGNRLGWVSPAVLGAAAVSVVAASGFVAIERRSTSPMIRFAALRRPALAAGAGCMFVMNMGFFTVYLLSTLFLQNVKRIDPGTTGWYLLVNNLAFFVANLWSDPLVRRIGPRHAGLIGMAAGAAGIAVYAGVDAQTPAALLTIPLALTGLAWGFAVTPFNTWAMNGAPPDEVGLDSGLLNLGRPLGAVTAAAVFGSVIAHAIATNALNGFTIGMHRTALAAAGLSAAAALTAWYTTGRAQRSADGSAAPDARTASS